MKTTYDIRSHCPSIIALILLLASPVLADWSQFRGPNASGLAPSADIPTDLSPDSSTWKTPIPLGRSSPVISADRIFLTAIDPSDKNQLQTLCLDRTTGHLLWTRSLTARSEQRRHPMNGPASPTPVADDKHIYTYFPTFGLVCYDHSGAESWTRPLDTPDNHFGTATSPILYKDTLILVLDDNSGKSRLLALDRTTGVIRYEQPRILSKTGWSTPAIWRRPSTDELIVLGFKRLTSYDPSTGEELWYADSYSPETMSVPVFGPDLLYVSAAALGGRADDKRDVTGTWQVITERFDRNKDDRIQRDEMTDGFTIPLRMELDYDNPGWGLPTRNMDSLMKYFDKDTDNIITKDEWFRTMSSFSKESRPNLTAIRPGAKGDARTSHIVWEIHRNIPETPSIIYHDTRLYLLRDGGIITCIDASDGKELFTHRLGASGQYTASPVIAGDKLITASTRGTVTVLRFTDTIEKISQHDFREKTFATPAITDNSLYLRTDKHIYAFRK